jgi:hypothetical protein
MAEGDPQETKPRLETEGSVILRRLRRLNLKRVQSAVLPWVLLCWALTAAIIVVLLWPGAFTSIALQPVPTADGLPGFAPPGWFRALVPFAGAILTGAAVMVRRTPHVGRANPRLRAVLVEAAIAAALATPVLLLFADHAWFFAVAALLLALAAELVRRGPRALQAILAAGPWLVLLGYQFTDAGRLSTSWVWIALFGLAAALASFGAYYGVARAAESRSRAIRVLFRERWNRVAVVLVALAAAAIIVLRMTILRELFPAPDPVLWFPWDRYWTSWVFAALVAAVLVAVAIRSTRRPLLRVGQRRVTAGLAVLGNLNLVFAAFLVMLGVVLAIFGTVDLPHEWSAVVPWLKFGGVALLGLLMLLPALRGTAARWLGIVAALFLVPTTLATALEDDLPFGFAPSPVQVTILLVAVSVVLAVVNLVRPTVRASLVARFGVVPLIAVHAGWLLPAVWTQFGLVVGVVFMLVALLLLQPPAARDNATHSVRILTGAALQTFGLAVALLAVPSLLDDPQLIVLGLVWLSVVVVAALCFETIAREPNEAVYTPERDPLTPVAESRATA